MAATEGILQSVSIPAASDLSSDQYKFVELDSNGRIGVVDAQGALAFGVLQDTPAAIDRAGNVAVGGLTKITLGGTVASGGFVASTAAGLAETASSGDYILGTCVEGGVSGEVGSVFYNPSGRVA